MSANGSKNELGEVRELLRMTMIQTAENAKQISATNRQITATNRQITRMAKEHDREMKEIRGLFKKMIKRIAV